MTTRSLEVLAAIDALTRQTGYAPTVREVGRAVGLTSSSTANGYIQRLRLAGLVENEPYCPRTLRLTEAGRVALKQQA